MAFRFVLVKLAARCNINCTYCYWFRDQSVYELPKLLPVEIEDLFVTRLRHHIEKNDLKSFSVSFHGGEPLLFGKDSFRRLCSKLQIVQECTGVSFRKSVTTNGLLIDPEWVDIFNAFSVNLTLSLDGTQDQHDRQRVDFHGYGTYRRVVDALALLRDGGIEPGILAVCSPGSSPDLLCDLFVNRLGIKHFDVLVPDATHEDAVESIESYYKRLFDIWLDDYSKRGVEIRFLENVVRGLLSRESTTEAIGIGPVNTLTMLTDGSLEPLDVLRIAGKGSTRTAYNVRDHDFEDIRSDPIWQEVQRASLNLNSACCSCEFHDACGGGYLPSRWSNANRFDNPSVYCKDLKAIFRHVWARVSPTLYVEPIHLESSK